LGNNSALPAFDRHPTSQALYFDDQIFLIDCGEGTQMQMAKFKIRRSRIHHIFISHLHGDHYFGLVGLITSMGLLGRETPLHIYGPEPLKAIIDIQLSAASNTLNYPLHFHAITAEGEILATEKFSVHCFPVRHRVECWGFIFREIKAPRKILKEKVISRDIPASFYKRLQMEKITFKKTTRRFIMVRSPFLIPREEVMPIAQILFSILTLQKR
jgi:ribonuclease Z